MHGDPDLDELLRRGEIDRAAALARDRGQFRKAAELLALAGRHAEAVLTAVHGGEWRAAIDLALASGDDRIVGAVCDELGASPDRASVAAAQAKMAHRPDVAARVLDPTLPDEAAPIWYEIGEYARAGAAWERVANAPQAMRAYEQHLAQNPDDVDIAERLADLRAGRGDVEGAVRALQSAQRTTMHPRIMGKLVDGLARLGLEGSARAVLRRLRAADPTSPEDVASYGTRLPSSEGAEKRYAGRYRVVREVGSGATGRVLEALDELTGERVALKVLSVGDDRSGAFGRFMREAELAHVLEDPNLVRMRALDPEGPTIVFDWMPGGTLADRIERLTVREARTIALRLLGALETLHRHGVVHRDLKPSNVLFDPAGQARLGDLGAAHLGDMGATVTGGLVGSLPYMAPEQITGAAVTAATDLYAFGCVLFQMLTGVLPFPGPDFVGQHLSAPIPTVSSARPALGTDYDALIASLLARSPEDRLAQVDDVRRVIAALPWTDAVASPVTPHVARASLRPSAPPAVRYTRSAEHEGLWRDERLQRDVERVEIPSSQLARARRWGALGLSDLQPVFDLEEHEGTWVAWVAPATGAREPWSGLDTEVRARLLPWLEQLEVVPDQVERVLDPAMGPVLLLRSALGLPRREPRDPACPRSP